MSFLKITDPIKRDQTVKEYLELKKNIRNNLLAERTGEQQLQTELTKFYRPITESQKATAKEITESQKATAREITKGLRPIKEGIENLPLTMLPKEEEEEKDEPDEDEDGTIGEIAKEYLNIPHEIHDTTLGVCKKGDHHYIGNKHVIIKDDDIIVDGEYYEGSPGLWELLMLKKPPVRDYPFTSYYDDYKKLMIQTNALHRENDPNNLYPKGNRGYKWTKILSPIWQEHREKVVEKRKEEWRKVGYKGDGVIIICRVILMRC